MVCQSLFPRLFYNLFFYYISYFVLSINLELKYLIQNHTKVFSIFLIFVLSTSYGKHFITLSSILTEKKNLFKHL